MKKLMISLILVFLFITSACSEEQVIYTYNTFKKVGLKNNECFSYNIRITPTPHENKLRGSPFNIYLYLKPHKKTDLNKCNVSIKSWKIKNLDSKEVFHIDSKNLNIVKNLDSSSFSISAFNVDMNYVDHVIDIDVEASFCNPSTKKLHFELEFIQKKEKISFWDIMMGI